MRTVVFINGHSRQAAHRIKAIEKYFNRPKNPFDVLEIIIVRELDEFDAKIERLKSIKNIECVIIGSGDGTIVAIFNALKDRKDLVYGFIPLGTANAYIKSLGIPWDFKKSLAILTNQNIRKATLGKVNGYIFANGADLGVPAQVAESVTNKVKRRLGMFAYVISGVRIALQHDHFECQVITDKETKKFLTHGIGVVNGQRGLVQYSQGNSAYDGELTIIYSDTPSRWEYLQDAFGFVLGTAERHRNVYFISITEATIKTKPIQPIQADGEVFGKTPAKVEVIKDAIKVLAPSPKTKTK